MTTADSDLSAPRSEEDCTSTLMQDLVAAETLRWREMRKFSHAHTGKLLDRVMARIDAWLGRV